MSRKKTFSAELDGSGITINPPTSKKSDRFLPQRYQPKLPSGSRNRITQQKLGLEESLRDQMATYMPMVLQQAIEKALNGDRQMIKLLLEMHISKAAAADDEMQGKDTVRVTIKDLTLDPSKANVTITKDITPIKDIEDGD